MTAGSPSKPYADLVLARTEEPSRSWFEKAIGSLAAGAEASRLAAFFAGAGRRLSQTAVRGTREEAARIEAAGLRQPDGWALDEVARAALLIEATFRLPAGDQQGLVADLFVRGDNRERQAILRALGMLPRPERFLETAVEACRTNVVPIFEAIACENPYPAAHFPTSSFNQMVVKALFLGVSLRRIEGLADRMNPDLARMAGDYASERRAAGRAVPEDINLILGPGRNG